MTSKTIGERSPPHRHSFDAQLGIDSEAIRRCPLLRLGMNPGGCAHHMTTLLVEMCCQKITHALSP